MPVINFNGQKYDVNDTKAGLLSMLIEKYPTSEDESDAIRFTINRNSSIACFESSHLRFVVITHFYSSWTQLCGIPKGSFPYPCVDSPDKLKFESLPPQEAFYSTLKQECISDEDYEFCKCVWLEEMRTTCDFLVCYNNCDVKPSVG